MLYQFLQFFSLFLLMLVTGIFWGPWFALHRSLKVFNEDEFLHIVKTLAANLAKPMQIMMPLCIFLMLLSVWFYPEKGSIGFYFNVTAFCLTMLSLLITLLVEVPHVNQFKQWTVDTIPSNWGEIRDHWVKFHVMRTFASLTSFASFVTSVLFL